MWQNRFKQCHQNCGVALGLEWVGLGHCIEQMILFFVCQWRFTVGVVNSKSLIAKEYENLPGSGVLSFYSL